MGLSGIGESHIKLVLKPGVISHSDDRQVYVQAMLDSSNIKEVSVLAILVLYEAINN